VAPWGTQHVFISHSSKDDGVVAAIRLALEGLGRSVWVDSRRLTGGDTLDREIRAAIDGARHFVAVLSPRAVNSRWVAKEIRYALEGAEEAHRRLPGDPGPARRHRARGARPLVRRGAGRNPDPVGPGGIGSALPDLLAALGERLRPTRRRRRRGTPPRSPT
jgi:hypothetical protein